MRPFFRNLLLFSIILVSFIAAFLLPTIILPPNSRILAGMEQEMNSFFVYFLIYALYSSIVFYLIIKNSDVDGRDQLIGVLSSSFIVFPLMGFFESLFWGSAFQEVGVMEHVHTLARLSLTYTIISLVLYLLNRKKVSPKRVSWLKPEPHVVRNVFIIGLVYLVVYYFFGYYIAWHFSETRIFYTGSSELKSFVEHVLLGNLLDLEFVFIHYLRGVLFGVAGYCLSSILSSKRRLMVLIFSLFFGGFGIQLIMPNPFFPEMVRISHLFETTLSMLFFGGVMSYFLE